VALDIAGYKEIVVFGTGQAALSFVNENHCEYGFFVDNNIEKWGSILFEKPVKSPDSLSSNDHFVIVASMYYEEIATQLGDLGFKEGSDFIFYENFLTKLKVQRIRESVLTLYNIDQTNECELLSRVDTVFDALFLEFDRVLQYTKGFLTRFDVAAIIYISLLGKARSNNEIFKAVEIGSWTGFSSFFISKSINSINGEGGQLYCVDSWGGFSAYAPENNYTQFVDVMHIFRGLMKGLDVSRYIRVLNMVSDDAWDIVKDRYFDLIFIDGDHTYDFVKRDTLSALTKIKNGGVIFGHDFQHHSAPLPPIEWFEMNREKRHAEYDKRGYFPGVNLAILELFDNEHHVIPFTSIWAKRLQMDQEVEPSGGIIR
jgi:predicted O-methyltransferase YrrM